MIRKIHRHTRSLLFKDTKKDWPYLVQVIFLFLLIGFPIYAGAVIPGTKVGFDALFIIFIFYGIILLEKPSLVFLISAIASILLLLFKSTGQIIHSEVATYWMQRLEAIFPIIYFSLLGLRLVGDTLEEKVSAKLLYISIANYFTIGILFSFVYQLIHITDLQAFNFSPEIKYNYLYMSFISCRPLALATYCRFQLRRSRLSSWSRSRASSTSLFS